MLVQTPAPVCGATGEFRLELVGGPRELRPREDPD
eukprot:COSAG04_NODE_23350_length_340_cov_0.643154_1_plen_34_part_01